MRTVIRNIGQLVTMAGPNRGRYKSEMSDIGLVPDGVVQILHDRIEYAGPAKGAPSFEHDEEIDAEGGLVTPGLIDAHSHAVFAGNRADEFEERATGVSYQEIAARGGGILSTVRKTREASEIELLAQSTKHAEWMIRCGTTLAEVKSGYGLNLETELKMLRVAGQLEATGLGVVRTFLGCHAVPPEAHTKLDYLNHVIYDMLPAVAKDCEYVDMFVEDKYFDAKDARRYAEAARSHGLGVRLHVDQMRDSGGALLAAQIGADTADHLEFSNIQAISMMGIHGVTPILLPGSVYGIRSNHYPEFGPMRNEALPWVLATDFNPGSSPTPSLPFVMSLAVTKMGFTAAEALTATTINAAHSLKRAEKYGSLMPGKAADVVIWDVSDYRELPYWFGSSMAKRVIKFGQTIWVG